MTTYERRRSVDKAWFQTKLDERDLSMRALAKIMGVDPSTVSLMIRGLRGLNMDNAQKMATIFNVTVAEVYKRAGLPIEDEARTIPVAMYVDRKARWHEIPVEARDNISAPYDTPSSAYAVQVRTGEQHDGWLMIVDGGKLPPEKCLGALCSYCDANGNISHGILRRGYRSDRYNVSRNLIAVETDVTDVDIIWASPVLWIKPIAPV